ncbi:uncharacterised protein [Colletotrichum tofieldiae]|nr:uncharacterised protein [Colletotrichum tofieldiae]
MPNCRFHLLLQKAFDMVAELRSMADSFLTAKEKQDGEALAMLKSRQELTIQSMAGQIKALQREEAVRSVEALQDLRRSHASRLRYYLELTGESSSLVPGEEEDWVDLEQQIDKPSKEDNLRMTGNEKLEMKKANSAAALAFKASNLDTTAAALVALPYFTTTVQPFGMGMTIKFDTENVSKGIKGSSGVLKLLSEYQSNEGARASRTQQMVRQLQERRLQANMAGRDIKNVDRQIITAHARITTCDAEMAMQAEQLAQAQQTTEWYRTKYSNEQLYAWLETRSRTLLYDTYIMAIDLARKAEKVFQFEHAPGRTAAVFLSPQGYWDSGHDGLLAAQNIQLALRRMEAAFLDRAGPDFEICKVVSLRQLNPMALFDLQRAGEAQFSLPEVLFDMDFPGHYLRRIRSVAVSVPCITGPYTSLNCTLSLLQHKYRVSPAAAGGAYAEKPGGEDDRFRTDKIPISSIAVGDRSLDTGRFDMNFGGERFLPFENAGVLNTWKMELPKVQLRQFDYGTISDVVLTLRYTSRQGGPRLKDLAEKSAAEFISKATGAGSSGSAAAAIAPAPSEPCAWVDLKNDYYNSFLALSQPGSKVTTVFLTGLADKLPFWARGRPATAHGINLYVQTRDKKRPFAGPFTSPRTR